jgi:hypothetical protein
MIDVTLEYYPFVLLDLGGTDRDEADLRRMFDVLHEANVRGARDKTKHVLVGTARAAPSARERQLIAAYSNKVPIEERACFLGCVAVVPNALLRGVATALGWLVPGLPPMKYVETTAAAIPAAVELLRKHGEAYREADAQLAARWFTRASARIAVQPRAS